MFLSREEWREQIPMREDRSWDLVLILRDDAAHK